MNSSITIVTAYFDIGRGQWTADKGFSPHLERTTDEYISYFKNLAELDNEMVVYTSSDLKPKIEAIRKGKPTTVIAFDVDEKFKNIKKRIAKIQNDESFRKLLPPRQLINPEYWSPGYALVCNLKSYFVEKAIKDNIVSNELVAWIDFGYCRKKETIRHVKEWRFPFNQEKMHFFTIRNGLKLKSIDSVFDCMINNRVFVIGGAVVGSRKKWSEFYRLVCACQYKTLKNNLVDDDQGIFLMCYHYRPDMIKLNYLGKRRWFDLFKRFNDSRFHALFYGIKLRLLFR